MCKLPIRTLRLRNLTTRAMSMARKPTLMKTSMLMLPVSTAFKLRKMLLLQLCGLCHQHRNMEVHTLLLTAFNLCTIKA